MFWTTPTNPTRARQVAPRYMVSATIYGALLYIYIYIYINIHIHIHIYIYICICYISTPVKPWSSWRPSHTTHRNQSRMHAWHVYGQSLYWHYGFQRVWLKHNINYKGWNFHVHREIPGKFESSNVSRRNVSRRIGRTATLILEQHVSGGAERSDMEHSVPAYCEVLASVYIYIYVYTHTYTHIYIYLKAWLLTNRARFSTSLRVQLLKRALRSGFGRFETVTGFVFVFVCMYACMSVCIYIYIYIHIHTYNIYIHIWCVCMCIYIYISLSLYIYIYIYIIHNTS